MPIPAFLENILTRWLGQSARVRQIRELPGAMHEIILEGRDLQKVQWTPGDKVRIFVGGGNLRTYTPVEWNASEGIVRFLIHRHGQGPGSDWISRLKVGERVGFINPERSLKPPRPDAQVLLFGDETTLALATALAQAHGKPILGFFECTDPAAVQSLDQQRFPKIVAVPKKADDTHLDALIEAALPHVNADGMVDVILAGRAAALGRIRPALQKNRRGDVKLQMKVYWAAGKRGLD